jgi:hypothetical protein
MVSSDYHYGTYPSASHLKAMIEALRGYMPNHSFPAEQEAFIRDKAMMIVNNFMQKQQDYAFAPLCNLIHELIEMNIFDDIPSDLKKLYLDKREDKNIRWYQSDELPEKRKCIDAFISKKEAEKPVERVAIYKG